MCAVLALISFHKSCGEVRRVQLPFRVSVLAYGKRNEAMIVSVYGGLRILFEMHYCAFGRVGIWGNFRLLEKALKAS